ncbi:hypothetical protein CHLRE_13g602850v5 [Chlamydomonas reinhardtii]|uniref:RRM domain-containing protein n=1 Tax=Chlamydomonas reinhardtii TaxID=3055 RepID=A0A2K3D171_CHLRE|nr:uncharacterized protein CHLRE_13g602850v5 [Chlamydomonas reinhardtii]PNW74288.1 hypothetical protein CHLRE_13g602850v5 [Chlamydomonas reinhardtii]
MDRSPDRDREDRGREERYRSASPRRASPVRRSRSPARRRSRSPPRRSPERAPEGGDRRDRERRTERRSRSRSRDRVLDRDRDRERERDRDRRRSRSRSRDRRRSRSRSPRRRDSRSPVRYGLPPADRTPPRPGTQLFVSGIDFRVSERELERKFSEFGRVKEARVVRNPFSGQSRGFAFVGMSSTDEAERAARDMHGREWSGRRLQVEIARNPR